jgi:hypothetical protein
MKAAAVEQPTITKQTIEVSVKDRPALWHLICQNAWAGRYLGKNRFVLTDDQVAKAREAGLKFRIV